MLVNFYWVLIALLGLGVVYLLGIKLGKVKPALVLALVIAISGHLIYYFYLEQILVKRWGGSMSLQVPSGQYHLGVTWKDDHLWIQNYDPATNECIFREYSRGSLLEGQVKLRNCNPLHLLSAEHLLPLLQQHSQAAPEATTN